MTVTASAVCQPQRMDSRHNKGLFSAVMCARTASKNIAVCMLVAHRRPRLTRLSDRHVISGDLVVTLPIDSQNISYIEPPLLTRLLQRL